MTSDTELEARDNAELLALLNDSSAETEAQLRVNFLNFRMFDIPEDPKDETMDTDDSVVLPVLETSTCRTQPIVQRNDKFVDGQLLRWYPDIYQRDILAQRSRTSGCSRILWHSFLDDASSWDLVEDHLFTVMEQHFCGYLGGSHERARGLAGLNSNS